MLKFGVASIFPPARSALEKLKLAERLDFDTFWIADSHLIWNEAYSLLGWLIAQCESERLQFGTMVTNPVSRDPIVVASAFATLQDVSGGRMLCGIGRGDSAVRVLNRRPAKVAELAAAATLIQTLARGDSLEIDGNKECLEWATGVPVPVFVAGYGARVLETAGRVGNGVIIECADPHYISWALEHVHRGAREAGRDPSELSVLASTATYVSDDIELARDQVRPLGAVVGNHVVEVLRNTGANSLPPELEAFVASRPDYDYHKHGHRDVGQADYVLDSMIDRLCIVGSRDRCVERLKELVAVGVTHVNFYGQTDNYDEQMELYAREIIPQFRDAS
jgi:probable F420-dependent oxidoreductase